jgi:hypothetical protein
MRKTTDDERPGMSVGQVMASLRLKLGPAIEHELQPIIDSADDQELARRIAAEASIAAARAVKPALQRLETYLMYALHTQVKLNEALGVIAALQAQRRTAGAYN